MFRRRVLYCFATLLLLTTSLPRIVVQAQLTDPPNELFQMSKEFITIGRTTQCLADLGANRNILARTFQIADAVVAYFSKAVRGRQRSDGESVQIVRVSLVNSLPYLQAIDARCSNISSPYMPTTTPPGAMELATLGKALEAIGTHVECLTQKIDATIVPRIPGIFAKNIEGIARDAGSSRSSVAILLQHEVTTVEDLQKLTRACF